MTDGAGWARDLGLVVVLVAAAAVVLLGVDVPQPVVWALGVPFLVVLPGYAIVAALFPEDTGRVRSESAQPWHEPDHLVRFGLSLIVSVIVVALVGVVLALFGAVRLVPAVVGIAAITLVAVAVAAVRRRQVRPASRATPLSNDSRVWGQLSMGSSVQNVATAVALLVLLGTLGFTVAAPAGDQAYTEFYLLSENENGTLTASNPPTEFVSGESETLHVGLENQEGQQTDYEVVMLAQAVDDDGSVIIQQEVDRFDTQLADGEATTVEREVAPTIVGDQIRLRVLLYEGEAPDNPSAGSADDSLHIWIDVVEG